MIQFALSLPVQTPTDTTLHIYSYERVTLSEYNFLAHVFLKDHAPLCLMFNKDRLTN
jgi:hypothetical protein